jgi:hypothetical protein
MKRILSLAACLVGTCACAIAQAAKPAVIEYELDFPGRSPPHFTLTIAEDGSGTYKVPQSEAAPDQLVQSFQLAPASIAVWFADARSLHRFQGRFESSHKVAFTGTKTLRYSGADGQGSVTVNYTQQEKLAALLSQLQQLAATVQAGQRLQSDLKYRRLGLDADMEEWQRELAEHLAAHPEAIAPLLHQIADDPQVLERVSRRAKQILVSCGN